MPSAVTLPTFSDEEILTHQTLTALTQAINARFTAGIGTADLAWPLTAEGNLDMSVFDVVGGHKIWSVVNASNYTDLTSALAAAGTGGVVMVPPATTVTAAVGGETLPSGVVIIGAGPSSVIKMAASATADMLTTVSGVSLSNLTLDGASVGNKYGVNVSNGTNVTIQNVRTQNFTGTTSGAGIFIGGGVVSVNIDGYYSSNSYDGLVCDGCTNLSLANVRLLSYTNKGLNFNPGSVPTRIVADNVLVSSVSGKEGIQILGTGAVGGGSAIEFYGNNIHVTGTSGATTGIVLGTSAAALKRVVLTSGSVAAATLDGIAISAGQGLVGWIALDAVTQTGVDLTTSTNIKVANCTVRTATNGVDISDAGCNGCDVTDNTFVNVTGAGVLQGDNTSVQWGNRAVGSTVDVAGMLPTCGYSNTTKVTVAFSATTTTHTHVIKKSALRVGSVLRVTADGTNWGNAAANAVWLKLNSVTLVALDLTGKSGGTSHLIDLTLTIKSATTGQGSYTVTNTAGATHSNYGEYIGLDITADQNLELICGITNDASTSFDARSLVVTIMNTAHSV